MRKNHLNPNWATEVCGFYFADESDLNETGWFDPWYRPIEKKAFSKPHRTNTPVNKWNMRTLKRKHEGKWVRLDVYKHLGAK